MVRGGWLLGGNTDNTSSTFSQASELVILVPMIPVTLLLPPPLSPLSCHLLHPRRSLRLQDLQYLCRPLHSLLKASFINVRRFRLLCWSALVLRKRSLKA